MRKIVSVVLALFLLAVMASGCAAPAFKGTVTVDEVSLNPKTLSSVRTITVTFDSGNQWEFTGSDAFFFKDGRTYYLEAHYSLSRLHWMIDEIREE